MQFEGKHMKTVKTRKLLLLVSLALIFLTPRAQAAVNVSADIVKDTTWSVKNSPYRITTDIELAENVSLKIEPGVRVEFYPEKSLEVKGKLQAIGTESEPIIFTSFNEQPWKNISFTDFSDDPIFSEKGDFIDGCILRHCIIEKGGGLFIRFGSPLVTKCEIRNNISSGIRVEFGGPHIIGNRIHGNSTEHDSASGNGGGIIAYTDRDVPIKDNIIYNNVSEGGRDGGGGIYAYAADNAKITIINNVIFGNTSSRFGGGIYAYKSLLSKNTIINNEAAERGGGIYAVESEVVDNLVQANSAERGGGVFTENGYIKSNSLIRNRAERTEGGGLHYFGSGVVEDNCIAANTAAGERACGGIYVSGNPIIQNNNILGNSGYQLYVANVSDAPDVLATNNYWGTGSEQSILKMTYDWFDSDLAGLSIYNPYQTQFLSGTPPPPPVNLRAMSKDNGIKLVWEEPAETSLTGHRVYVATKSGYPYDKVVDAGPENEITIPDLQTGQNYHFAVSNLISGKNQEVESGLSEEVQIYFSGAMESLTAPERLSPAGKQVNLSHDLVLKAAASTRKTSAAIYRWQVFAAGDNLLNPAIDVVTTGHGIRECRLDRQELLPGQQYNWRVAACSAAGSWSDWSRPATFKTEAAGLSQISGPIASTVTLNKSESPYFITQNTLVLPEGKLLIEPGVQLRIASGSDLKVRGTLVARGNPADIIIFTNDSSEKWGNLIFSDETIDCTLDDNKTYQSGTALENCRIEKGRGIVIEAASPLVKNCIIANNDGSGIIVRQGGPLIMNNEIHHNVAPTNGGGIYAYTNDIIYVLSNKIHENKAEGDGGGIYAYGYMNTSTIHVEDNDIYRNTAAGSGGGIYLSRSSAVGNRIDANFAKTGGGGVYSTFGLVDANTITGNRAEEGGGIYTEHNSSITRNVMSENEISSRFGGGAYINFWGMSIENESFTNNTVTTNKASATDGNGGVYVIGSLIFSHNNIYANAGSQLYNANDSDAPTLSTDNCYWGGSDKDTIATGIIDGDDDPGLGKVTFEPFLAEPVTAP